MPSKHCQICKKKARPGTDTVVKGSHDACLRRALQVDISNRALAKSSAAKGLRLKLVKLADFRSSEVTHLQSIDDAVVQSLTSRDVVAFVSMSGNQLVFVHNFDEAETEKGTKRRVLRSQRWRLQRGSSWEPRMLANYAEQVGIHLDSKRFETYFKKYTDEAAKQLKEGG